MADVHGPDGQPCDHLVVMRRMPSERSLTALVEAGEPVQDALRDLARLIARFHAEGDHSAEVSAEGSRDAVRRRWREHLEDLRPFRGQLLDDIFCLDDGPGRWTAPCCGSTTSPIARSCG